MFQSSLQHASYCEAGLERTRGKVTPQLKPSVARASACMNPMRILSSAVNVKVLKRRHANDAIFFPPTALHVHVMKLQQAQVNSGNH